MLYSSNKRSGVWPAAGQANKKMLNKIRWLNIVTNSTDFVYTYGADYTVYIFTMCFL